MKALLSLWIVLNVSVAFASDLRKQVLPPSLAALQFHKDTPASVEKSLGKPKEQEKKHGCLFYYYNNYGLNLSLIHI